MTRQRLEQMTLTLIPYSWHLTLESYGKPGFSPQQMLCHLLPAPSSKREATGRLLLSLSESLEMAITSGSSLVTHDWSSSRQPRKPRSKEKHYPREGKGRGVLVGSDTVRVPENS